MEGQFITNKELILSGIINYQYVKSNLYRTIAKDENKK